MKCLISFALLALMPLVVLPRAKQFIYDEGLHIPLIIRWPARIKMGCVSGELVSNLDIVPTLLDLAGLPKRGCLPGRSLADESQKEPEFVFGGRDKMDDTHDASRTVRSRRFRYILNLMPERAYCQFNQYKEQGYPGLAVMNVLHLQGKLPPEQDAFMLDRKPEEELFDIERDPGEVHNLARNPASAETLKRFREILAGWRLSVGDAGVTAGFRSGGWPGTYPTRSLSEWLQIESLWEKHVLHGAPNPKIAVPSQFLPMAKHPKREKSE